MQRCRSRLHPEPRAMGPAMLLAVVILAALCPGLSSVSLGSTQEPGANYTISANSTYMGTEALPWTGEIITTNSTHVGAETLPWSGDVVGKVHQKLAIDRRTLGRVTASLMSVQSDVAHTEQSMLGRVLDIQSSQTFFRRHEAIRVQNQNLEWEVKQLSIRTAGLSSKLHELRRELTSNANLYSLSENKLRTQVGEDKAMIRDLEAELEKQHWVREAVERLENVHKELVESIKNGTLKEKRLMQMLHKSQSARCAEEKRQSKMRAHLEELHQYNKGCHASVQKISQNLESVAVDTSNDASAYTLTLHQQRNAKTAMEQRMSDAHAALVSQAGRAEKQEIEELQILRDLRVTLQNLENTSSSERDALKHDIVLEKEHLRLLSTSLSENAKAESEDHARKEAQDKLMSKLTKQVHHSENSVSEKALQQQNDILQREINEESAKLREAQTREHAALLAVQEAEAELVAAKQVLEVAEAAAAEADSEAGGGFMGPEPKKPEGAAFLAVKRTAKNVPAIPPQCSLAWDAIWTQKRAELKDCKHLEKQLVFENKLKDTMLRAMEAMAPQQ